METGCCVVGGGPAGVFLSLLLARSGISVTLLERQDDFDRDFRGDTLLPSTLECLFDIGLADGVLSLPHSKLERIVLKSGNQTIPIADFRRVGSRFRYIAVLPQARLLEFLVREASVYPNFRLIRGANVSELIQIGSAVHGVRCTVNGNVEEIRSVLVVGADGRFSRLRQLAGLVPRNVSSSFEILWFRVGRRAAEADELAAVAGKSVVIMPVHAAGRNHFLVILDCADYWQIGYVIPSGRYSEIRAAGIELFREGIRSALPPLRCAMADLTEWKQISRLTIQPSYLAAWHRPGLLMIGDAAHVMSPSGGVGINYAIQDAVVASRLLERPIRSGSVPLSRLAAIQRRRKWPVRAIQGFQAFEHHWIVARALSSRQSYVLPGGLRMLLRNGVVQSFLTRFIAFGLWRVRINKGLVEK